MIRLRNEIDRALRHRWLGPIILLVLVGLLALVILHLTVDQVLEASVVCMAIVILIVGFAKPFRFPLGGVQSPPSPSRGPPLRLTSRLLSAPAFVAPLPLRL